MNHTKNDFRTSFTQPHLITCLSRQRQMTMWHKLNETTEENFSNILADMVELTEKSNPEEEECKVHLSIIHYLYINVNVKLIHVFSVY